MLQTERNCSACEKFNTFNLGACLENMHILVQTTQLISCLLANIKTTDRTGKLFAMFCSVGKIHKDTASK